MLKISRLDDTFSEIFALEENPVEGQSITQIDKERRKRKGEKRKLKKPKSPNFDP